MSRDLVRSRAEEGGSALLLRVKLKVASGWFQRFLAQAAHQGHCGFNPSLLSRGQGERRVEVGILLWWNRGVLGTLGTPAGLAHL